MSNCKIFCLTVFVLEKKKEKTTNSRQQYICAINLCIRVCSAKKKKKKDK